MLAILRLQVLRHANQAAVVAKIMSSYGNGPDDLYDVARVNAHVAQYIDNDTPNDGFSWGGLGFQTPSGLAKRIADSIGLNYTFDVTFASVGGNQGNPRQLLELAKELPRIRHLTFHKCKNADRYIDQLAEFTQVETIELLYTNVSLASVKKLRETLPRVNVIVNKSYADYFTAR
jgi:hypothetical protein